jgi:hypothetical protein
MTTEADIIRLVEDLSSMCERLAKQVENALYGKLDQVTCLKLLEEYRADFEQQTEERATGERGRR